MAVAPYRRVGIPTVRSGNTDNNKPEFAGEWVKLGDVCEINSGGTPKRSVPEYWSNGTIPWVKIGDIKQKYVSSTEEKITEAGLAHSAAKRLAPGTLLFSIFASIGAVGILDVSAATNQAIASLKIKDDLIDADYLYHWLRGQETATKRAAHGVAQENINLSILRNMMVPIPDRAIQQSIANKFNLIDEQIGVAKLLQADLDDLVKSQFVEMFGGYGADSEYRCARLGKLLSVEPQNGLYKPQRYYRTDCGGTPIVRVDAFSDGSVFSYASLKRLDCSESELENFALHEGDIVMNRVNGSIERVGKVALIKGLDEATVYESNMMRFHVDESRLNATYIVHVLCSDDIRKQIKSCARIANQCSVNQENIAGLQIPLPPLALQCQFADFVARVDKLGFGIWLACKSLHEPITHFYHQI